LPRRRFSSKAGLVQTVCLMAWLRLALMLRNTTSQCLTPNRHLLAHIFGEIVVGAFAVVADMGFGIPFHDAVGEGSQGRYLDQYRPSFAALAVAQHGIFLDDFLIKALISLEVIGTRHGFTPLESRCTQQSISCP